MNQYQCTMEELTEEQIIELQKEYGLTEIQNLINSGDAWKLEGHVGRTASSTLEQGACMLPEVEHRDYYGNTIPKRSDVKDGHKGTLGCSQYFWERVLSGEIELDRPEDEDED